MKILSGIAAGEHIERSFILGVPRLVDPPRRHAPTPGADSATLDAAGYGPDRTSALTAQLITRSLAS
ncbi:hypothetical protein ACIA5E_18055 [Nocardia asteroides]|uniref:hypothetical protein n=1 Tax=Nocardia asteroides TaxID=1824 RepID=UPI0037A32AD3